MKILQRLVTVLLILGMTAGSVLAAPVQPAAPAGPAATAGSTLQKIRFSQTPEKIRLVFDLDKIPAYNVKLQQTPLQLTIDLPGTVDKSGSSRMVFNDPFVDGLSVTQLKSGGLEAVIDLKMAVGYNVFTLKSPNRLVVDLIKSYEQKITEDVAPGIKYTYWLHSMPFGPIQAHILDIDPQAGYALQPVLGGDSITAGVETVSSMAQRFPQAVAAVNGSYFDPDGQIWGLLKIDGTIASIPELPRTAMGILPGGRILIDQVNYQGNITLPDGSQVPISGVNCERETDSLVLYNHYFGEATGTNPYGKEYVVKDGVIVAVNQANSKIPDDGVVLSAHGAAAAKMASLKVGDKVTVTQTLGPEWDKANVILGAGPMLVKDGSIFLTTKVEEFGSDVSGGRAPRTAFGITKDGHILLTVIDGRETDSVGVSLLELAILMQDLGAVDAMNFDGGSSSAMVIKGQLVNNPSDGQERKVGDALLVMPVKVAN
ncbi:phosphodiester glycosidase [Lucifera butyrica]|uniref:Phosphodiester glycosidase n=1 Tax=Lucifera butyrica TaxID=1351585 RepID=A0A498RE85_9FIRM|nr:phosphodiester glycosidase family protein [Lucifera butyrica]VBB09247.1 phosphodiester glycosidase [Lucifera butyrica]